jgi:hypothetical protein
MRIRSATYAIGSAADDEVGLDTISTSSHISNNNKRIIECRQMDYCKSIKEAGVACFGDCTLVGSTAVNSVLNFLSIRDSAAATDMRQSPPGLLGGLANSGL